MVQHIKSSTRVVESSRTIIDLIITKKSEKIQEVSTVLSTISDHYPVYINIKKPKTTIKKIKIKGRNYKNYTPEALNNVLKTMDWEKATVLPTIRKKYGDLRISLLKLDCSVNPYFSRH